MSLSSSQFSPRVAELLKRFDVLERAGRSRLAIRCLRSGVRFDSSPLVRLLLGMALVERGDSVEAISVLETAWDIARRQADPRWRCWSCHALAVAHYESGNLVRAHQFQQLALAAELRSAAEDEVCGLISGELRLTSAALLAAEQDCSSAERLWQSCLTGDNLSGVQGTAALCLGTLCSLEKRHRDALLWYRLARQRFKSADDRLGCSRAVCAIGEEELRLGNWRKAVRLLRQARQQARFSGAVSTRERVTRQLRLLRTTIRRFKANPEWN